MSQTQILRLSFVYYVKKMSQGILIKNGNNLNVKNVIL